MKAAVYEIPLPNLALMLVLVAVVAFIYFRWSLKTSTVLYATCRMLVQLIAVGYVLAFIFDAENAWIIIAVACFMLVIASWIALRPIKQGKQSVYPKVLLAISVGGILTLLLVTQVVLRLEPWYEPRYFVPLAGMIFSNSMNAVSLAAERFESEISRDTNYFEARRTAFDASLIPLTNSFFAVGLVSLPGMMTGQILSGVSPLIAARYQIMVMCMVFGAAGISSACYLSLLKNGFVQCRRAG